MEDGKVGIDFETLSHFANLHAAFRAARKGKRGQESVALFERNLEEELLLLEQELRDGSYRPGRYRSFYRIESKRRLISAAPFRDRVVHHALIQVIEPFFERRFIYDSYANRIGKGTHRALDRCTHFLRTGGYSLQCDVRQFFPSVDHLILMKDLECVIRDGRVLNLCQQILAGGTGILDEVYDPVWFPQDDLFSPIRPRGLPIGNLTSQFWANVYLDRLDHFVKHRLRCRRYLRYVDDFLLFAERKEQLHLWREQIEEFMAGLRLIIHPAAPIRPVQEGLPFLGFVVYPDHRRLKPRCGFAFRRRFRALIAAYSRGEITMDPMNASVRGWVAHAAHGDTWGLRRALLGALIPKLGS